MSLPEIVRRDVWTHARVALLEQEKALTKARDELAFARRRLPMVEIIEDYRFTAADGNTCTLRDLFEGRHQLIIDHYMFDPSWDEGCMSCTGRVDIVGPPSARKAALKGKREECGWPRAMLADVPEQKTLTTYHTKQHHKRYFTMDV